MAGGIDQIQLVDAAVAGVVVHADGVELDGDAALAFQVHRVEHLLPHQALVQGARELDQPVGQRRFPVVDVGHDAEVADVILAHVREKYRCRVSGVGYREASPPPDTRHPTPIFYVLPCPPSPAGSTLPPTAAPCGSPPTAICPPKAIPACGSRARGGAGPSPPENAKGKARVGEKGRCWV